MPPEVFDAASYWVNPYAIPVIATAGAQLALVVGVLMVERSSGVRFGFSLMATTVAIYLGCFGLMYMSARPDVALFWARASYLGVPLTGPATYSFATAVLGTMRRRSRRLAFMWASGVGLTLLSVTTDLVNVAVRPAPWGYHNQLGPAAIAVVALLVACTSLALLDGFSEYRRERGALRRLRIRALLVPLGFATLAVVDFVPSAGFDVYPFGYAVMLPFMAMAAWLAARHRMVDVTPAFAADTILDIMPDPLIVCDAELSIRAVNPAAALAMGDTTAALRGRRLSEFVTRPDGSDPLPRLAQHCTVRDEELVLRSRAGSIRPIGVSMFHLHDRAGEMVGAVVLARDIQQRKRIEEALRESERHFRALIENAADTITVIDAQGLIRYESPSVQRLLGHDPEASLGLTVFERVHPADRQRARQVFTQLLDRPGVPVTVELRVLHRDGSTRALECTARNLLDRPGVNGIVVNGRDITDSRLLERRLQEAQRLDAVGRLAGGIAHDFNNVLTAVQGHLLLLLDEVGQDAPIRGDLQIIREGAERAATLTRQLLAFSRRQVLQPKLVDLNQLVRDARGILRPLLGSDIEYVEHLEPALLPTRADPAQIEQILVSLVDNARDAMTAGGRLTVRTRLADVDAARATELDLDPGVYVVLELTDTGQGMDAETRARAFEPFFTTRATGTRMGLGLSTAYGIVRQSGGQLHVESELNVGTRVEIWLPHSTAPAADAAGSSSPAPAAGQTVLVVEDESGVRTLIRKVLSRSGYEVLEAENGRSALELAAHRTEPIDLLLTDVVMPELGGPELAQRLEEQRPGLRKLFISGYTPDEVFRRGLQEGEAPFLAKPFTPDALVRKVRDTLAGRS